MEEGRQVRMLVRWSRQDRRIAWTKGAGGDRTEWMGSEYILKVTPKRLADVKNEGKGEMKIDRGLIFSATGCVPEALRIEILELPLLPNVPVKKTSCDVMRRARHSLPM